MTDPDATSSVPAATIDTLTGVWNALSAIGESLTDADFKTPVGLPGWNVQAVYSHLIGTERMLEGLEAAPRRDASVLAPHVRNPIGDVIENEVALRAPRPGREVLAEWNDLIAARQRTLHAADAAYFAQPMMTPLGPGTMADFLAIRILDCWVHEQDVRWALGLEPTLSGPAAEHTVDRLCRTVPMVVGKRASAPEGAAVRVVIEPQRPGEVARDLSVEIRDGRARYVDAPTAPPLATVRFTTEAFVRLANGRRLTPDGSPDLSGVSLEGDSALAGKIATNFNQMI